MHFPRCMLPNRRASPSHLITGRHHVNSTKLQDRIAIVTGGSRGIGAAIARKLAAMAANVIICGRNQAELSQTAASLHSQGARCEALVCDVSDLRSVGQ